MTSNVTEHEGGREPASSAERDIDIDAGRRAFIRSVGLGTAAGAAVLGAGAGLMTPTEVRAQELTDAAIFNFALNLEYLEAEFYLRAAFGRGLADKDTTGRGPLGRVIGGRKVNFQSDTVRGFAEELAMDEQNHVEFIRDLLGDAAIARPTIDLRDSFTAAARAAGLVGPNGTFDPYANDINFLLASFIFEDVGVTAFQGAAPLINRANFLAAAAGILPVEAYHAGGIRTLLFERRQFSETKAISDLRDSVDGSDEMDQPVALPDMKPNIVPNNKQGITYPRNFRQVLNIVYLDAGASQGGFFPDGVNGPIKG